MGLLDELVQELDGKSEQERADLASKAGQIITERWVPNPGPQTEAYFSKADELLYGGEPGGGKSDLLLGLAYNCHNRSAILRREYGMMGKLLERVIAINGGDRRGFSGSTPPKMRHTGGLIDFYAAKDLGDEQKLQGNDHDLWGFDEATHFLWSQISFLTGWLRSDNPEQRCRVVFATNPPLSADGLWVHDKFAPWINANFPYPAQVGELRWVATDDSGKEQWVDGPEPVQFGGKLAHPKSRTFIKAGISDNPFYGVEYLKQIDNMDENVRAILMGGFGNTFKDQDWQLIPTAWIKEAQQRWLPRPPSGIPMCTISLDPGGGGADKVVLAPRYDGYFPKLKVIAGKDAPDGEVQAAELLQLRKDNATIVIDMGGGYGMDARSNLRGNLGPENYDKIKGHKGAEGSNARTEDGSFGFANKRSEVYWRFKEALNPKQPGGSPISLDPNDAELVSDLAAPTYIKNNHNQIELESKEKVMKKLGRSPGRSDAVVMSWAYGPTYITDGLGWAQSAEHGGFGISRTPKVNSGRKFMTGRR